MAVLVFATYMVAGLPAVSRAIAGRLPEYPPLLQLDRTSNEDILVILSGDNARGRAREARRLLGVITPRCILVSGSSWFVDVVVGAGIARDRFLIDSTAFTTREQISKLSTWKNECGANRVVLIASRISMPRVAALVRAEGVPVTLAPSPLDAEPAASGVWLGVPSYLALRISRDALYEHAALAYYRHRRWIQ